MGRSKRLNRKPDRRPWNHSSCTHLEVEDDGQHFYSTIVIPEFVGKRLVQRHQLVYAALGDRLKAEIHALSIKAFTPDGFAAQ